MEGVMNSNEHVANLGTGLSLSMYANASFLILHAIPLYEYRWKFRKDVAELACWN